MSVSIWTDADSAKAKQLWADYQLRHDLSSRAGETVGIDPLTGQFWFGESISDVVAKQDSDGVQGPLFFERVGSDFYWRKGGRP